jgi:hypothetical protein
MATNEFVPTHGTWTREDFCERCRSFNLGDWARGDRIPTCLPWLEYRAVSWCPLCRFFSIPVDSFPGGVYRKTFFANQEPIDEADLTPHSVFIPRGVIHAVSYILYEGVFQFSEKYIFPLSPGQTTEWPFSAAMRKSFYSRTDERRPLPFHCSRGDKVDINFLKSCIAGCRRFHSRHCVEPEPELLSRIQISPGFRLIDCVIRRIIKPPRIVEYIALSYVWGETLQQHSNGAESLPRETDKLPLVLPGTIEDAVTLSVQLGFQYLWVDKYCIDQSSPREVQTQLGLMDLIYYGAAITIIAAAGDDANSGLPGVGIRPRVVQPSIIIDGTTWLLGSLYTDQLIARSVWATRGWVGIYI